MRLQIGPNIDNTKVRLDFRNSPDRPSDVPSYSIEKSKADEFVTKYNEQEKKLFNLTVISALLFSIAGWLMNKHKHSPSKTFLGLAGGTITGLGIGTLISARKKNALMDKYNVKQL